MAPRNIYLVHCIELYYTARTHTTADQHHSSTLHHETLHDIAPHRTINSALNYASHYSTIQHATSDLYYTIYHTYSTSHLGRELGDDRKPAGVEEQPRSPPLNFPAGRLRDGPLLDRHLPGTRAGCKM